ncbi:uncharacterized protein LOC133194343 [Saccostrea echinata]|uniref:uncharacterized protein LOC133194343 n=1 Tax=Saccostrea echinata TaxID=191078 RepID=UPI002A82CF85|nr:uncharacterized protein LOC133194343 [Saccostrea echinata]
MEKRNRYGRVYLNGKSLSTDLRELIVQDICDMGGDIITKKVPKGVKKELAKKYKLVPDTITKVWLKHTEGEQLGKKSTGRPKILAKEDIEFISALKTARPSMQLETIREQVIQNSNTVQNVSTSTVCRTLKKDLSMTFKKITKYDKDRFTLYNLIFTQQFLNYIQHNNPYTLKFMDEMGISLSSGNPNYGHSVKGTRCVELTRYKRQANLTVSIIVGITGVKYVNIIDGPSNTAEFLKFVGEAVNSYTDEGEAVFSPWDCLVVRILRTYLPTLGIDYLFLPAYSPDMNPAEQCFRKVKTLLKSDRYMARMEKSLKVTVFKAFFEVSAGDTRSFFHATEIVNC